MSKRVPIDQAIEIALAPRMRRLAAKEISSQAEVRVRRKLAEARRAEKENARKAEGIAQQERLSTAVGVSPKTRADYARVYSPPQGN